eukprot:Skav228206  [mRNA]  locus=scaffold3579:15338:16420:+ [translate_table: standard]
MASEAESVEHTQQHHVCKLCARCLPADSPGRLHGKQWTCRHCCSLQQLLLRNLGPEDQQGFSTEARLDFFKRAASTQTGSYTWESVRTMIIDTQTTSHEHKRTSKVKGESLPLSVWVTRGYDPEKVKQFPSEEDPKLGTVYSVPVHSVTMADTRSRITAEIHQRERAAKKKKRSKGDEQEEQEEEDWDVVPHVAAACKAAPKKKAKAEPKEDKGSARAQKALEKQREKQDKANTTQANLSSKATAGLSRALTSAAALLTQATKAGCSVGDMEALKEAMAQGETWNKACVDCLTQAGLVKGSGAKLDPLPFDGKELGDYLKAVGATCKDLRSLVQAKKAAAKAAKAEDTSTAAPVPDAGKK